MLFVFAMMSLRSRTVLTVLVVLIVSCGLVIGVEQTYTKVCTGTNHGLSFSHNSSDAQYRQQYQNCTHILGNLELVFLDRHMGLENENRSYDLSFLSSIKEVTGYVLIVGMHVDVVPLTSLRIIRGQSLYVLDGSFRGYGLYVGQNYQPNAPGVGLKELQFNSLHEIMDGSVMFHNNYELCYEESVDWKDIMTGEGAEVFFKDDGDGVARQCVPCDPSCETSGQLRCWGGGPTMCQKLTRKCAVQCDGSCYGPMPNECCHPECVGGCTGPTKDMCWACRQVINGKTCEPHCPVEFIYKQGRLVPNPNFKYTYGTVCVDKCPEHLMSVAGTCVSVCSDGYFEDVNGKCAPCEGLCPKTCDVPEGAFVNANNIADFENCTVINGVLKILHSTLTSSSVRTPALADVNQLSVFETVREITGALVVQAKHPNFTSLSYFRNLRTIVGRQLLEQKYSLQIVHTTLRTLGLRSLSKIRFGTVAIAQNDYLCYASSINWNKIVNTSQIFRNGVSTNCSLCSNQCSSDGCWGPTEMDCVSCAHYLIKDQGLCVQSCENAEGFYADVQSRECKRCHEECSSSCSGPNNDECDFCKNVQDGAYCLSKCGNTQYNDSGQCVACSDGCDGGCTGPGKGVGPEACNFCSVVVIPAAAAEPHYCLPPDSECPDGYYLQSTKDDSGRRYRQCLPCNPLCITCDGPLTTACKRCVHFNETDSKGESRCVAACASGFYTNRGTSQCLPCHSTCSLCNGPTAAECTDCQEYRLYSNAEKRQNTTFTCVEQCPDTAPHIITELVNNQTKAICVTESVFQELIGVSKKKAGAIVGGVIAAIVLVGLVVIVVLYLRCQSARSEENKARIHAKIIGTPIDELEPLAPSDARPDMAQLKIVKESEIQKFDVIGSGAFGTVYKGAWVPPQENVKVVVAIKVLREGSSSAQNEELLEEARIMASVVHPHCTRVIAVCMTAQMMLIMPFVPNGSLLDYLRKNQSNIGSKSLLNWCTQIARGMEYLESRGIVHRDLAARNVLVHSKALVKITDFGLAKLLDKKQDAFQAEGGKMPIKWLAVESIHHRIFTHKSDVWSYGVTLWELFTFGQRPYENIPAMQIPNVLEKGERLSQPNICTIDVYMILIKCWMLDASSRPSFKELGENFAKMARDPGRYLVIQGDEFLKLPDSSFAASDLLSELSSGNEELITADDYLQPQHWANRGSSLKSSEKSKAAKDSKPVEDPRYGALEGKKSRPGDHRSSSRYISDPTGKGVQESTKNYDKPDSSDKKKASLYEPTDLEASLPANEDDYLIPQTSANSPAYMDIVPDEKKGQKAASASNPEYFDNGKARQSQPTQPRESEYYNNDLGHQPPKRNDSAAAAKSKRSLINESAV